MMNIVFFIKYIPIPCMWKSVIIELYCNMFWSNY